MKIKSINNFFGYGLYFVGAARLLIVVLSFLNAGAILVGGSSGSNYTQLFVGIVGLVQIVLAFASIIMIIVNTKNEPKVIKGYLYGLGAMFLEIFVPTLLKIYFIIVECSLYMKAGSIIVEGDSKGDKKRNKTLEKNTEWFFDEKREENRTLEIENQGNIKTEENTTLDKLQDSFEKLDNKLEKKGISISQILTVWIIIIVIILGIVFLKSILSNKNVEENSNSIEYKNIATNKNETTNIQKDQNAVSSNNRIEKKEESFNSGISELKETDERLIKITNIFNNSSAATTMYAQGYVLTAISSGNELTVYGSGDGINTTIVYTLNGDILSTEVVEDKNNYEISLSRILHAMFLLDSVGMYKGYPERTIINAFNEEESKYYTIENEGIELKEDPETGNIIIKVDLNKDFSFLNNN